MPTYEYKCQKTGKHFEFIQTMTDPPHEKCPECGAPLKRIITGGCAAVFKGSGFYATDYASSSPKKHE
ncbi:MAG: zinc ribbon domain-containing protein [Planctomycetes bacterium]|nr:zinc ribbon domain-containing protein [Planctomycetota bacterium]